MSSKRRTYKYIHTQASLDLFSDRQIGRRSNSESIYLLKNDVL